MDFKARFAGKTSKITASGDVDGGVKVDFDKAGNLPSSNATRTNSIRKVPHGS